MSVVSLRLKERDVKRIKELSSLEGKDKSTVARELLASGWEFRMIRLYRDGKLSLGGLSARLDSSVSETIDMLAELGIKAPIEYDDYLSGFAKEV